LGAASKTRNIKALLVQLAGVWDADLVEEVKMHCSRWHSQKVPVQAELAAPGDSWD
jgi:hypothetical protein